MTKKFIVFEGISGSGKSTQVKMLAQWFETEKIPFVQTHEPTKGELGEKIRELAFTPDLKGETVERVQMLYILDRKDDIEKNITLALKAGKVVIADRYFLSTLAYGEAFGVSWHRLLDAHKMLLGNEFPQPDITFILDIDPMIAFERSKQKEAPTDYFETLERMRKIREAYLKAGKHFKDIHILDASQKPESIHKQVSAFLK
ncbi:dTMP kinase [Candidatus Parcubacteria bacterium]|nr:MAG: dTMP kinase [Candidatus Parcubacteria bacterium]